MTWAAKWVVVAALAFALGAYGLDCVGMATPEQSMECCKTMRCHSPLAHHSHPSKDCCDTTPTMHASLGQPSLGQSIPFSPVALGVVEAFSDSQMIGFVPSTLAAHSHDPPLPSVIPALTLRI